MTTEEKMAVNTTPYALLDEECKQYVNDALNNKEFEVNYYDFNDTNFIVKQSDNIDKRSVYRVTKKAVTPSIVKHEVGCDAFPDLDRVQVLTPDEIWYKS